MKLKRFIFTVLSLILAVSMLLSGCGTKANPTENSTAAESTSTQKSDASQQSTGTDTAKLDPYEIVWVYGGTAQKDTQLIEEEVNKYLKDKINVTIKLQQYDWNNFGQKRDLMIASNEKMDICFSGGWCGYFENLAKGAYLNIAPLLDKYAPKTKAMISEGLWAGARYKGGIYGIPANKEGAQDWGFLYRKDITDKYNIDMSGVKTLDDFEKVLYDVHKKEPNLIAAQNASLEAFYLFGNNSDWLNFANNAVGLDYGTDKFKAVANIEKPEIMEAWKRAHKWYQDGLINKDVLTRQEMSTAQNAGQVFSYVMNLKPYKDAEVNAGAPKGQEWKQIDMTVAVANQDAVAGSLQNIPKTCKNPERTMMFLELFNSDKFLNNLINFGIEGKHYKKTGDNRIEYADGVTPANSGYNPQLSWMFGNTFINYLWPSEKDDKYQKFDEYNKGAVVSKVVSFVFDQAPVKTEIAALGNISNQYRNPLMYGVADPTVEGPKYIKKMKDAGLDKVIAEVQKQLDAWAAGNK